MSDCIVATTVKVLLGIPSEVSLLRQLYREALKVLTQSTKKLYTKIERSRRY